MQPEQKPSTSTLLFKDLRPIETGQGKPLQTFTAGSDVSTPITANNGQTWKNTIRQIKKPSHYSIIAKGTLKYQELIEHKNELERTNLLINLAPPDLLPVLTKRTEDHYQSISRKQQETEEKLNFLDSELSSTDLWSFPIISKRSEEYTEGLFKSVESLRDQIGKLGESVKLAEEIRRERDEKAEPLKRKLLHLETRLRELDLRVNDEEEELERNINYQSNLMAESKKSKSHTGLQDLELAIKSLNDGLINLRKETVSITDLGPAVKIQSDDHLNVQKRLISLIDEKQVIIDKQIRQFSQDFNQYFLEFGKMDPVAEALNAFEADIFSAVDKCIDEQKSLIEEVIQKDYNDSQQYLDNLMGPIEKELTSIFEDMKISDSSVV